MFAIDITLAICAVIATYLVGRRHGYGLHRQLVEAKLKQAHNDAANDLSLERAARRLLRMRLHWHGRRRLLDPPRR